MPEEQKPVPPPTKMLEEGQHPSEKWVAERTSFSLSQKVGIVGLFLTTVVSLLYIGYRMSERNKETRNLYEIAAKQNVEEKRKSDSLLRITQSLDKYRHAAEYQAFRDSVVRRLEFKPGDVVYKKTDSSKVLVYDIVMGGGKFDYYFHYKILDKNNKEEEVRPELLTKF